MPIYLKKIHKIIIFTLILVFTSTVCLLSFTAFGESEGSKKLIILMYHSLLKDNSLSNKYILSPDEFEKDIKTLISKGYQTVSIKELKEYVSGKSKNFPNNSVIITFDDGHYNNYLYAFPFLKQNDMKAVISIVGKLTEESDNESKQSANYSYVNTDQLCEMTESGVFEIANHSYDLHKITNIRRGSSKSKFESEYEYAARFKKDTKLTNDLLFERCAYNTDIYTYPFGAISKQTDVILKELGYNVTLSCEEGINEIRIGMDLFRLKRYNRSGNISSDDFFKNKLNL